MTGSRTPNRYGCRSDGYRVPVDFYTTAAQVFPVLFLAIAWDSQYFKRLRDRTDDDVKIWTLSRIRAFGLVLCSWNIASLCVALFVLAGLFDDAILLRLIVLVGLVVSAGTLLYRIYEDLREATMRPPSISS
jgi:hypothetical protein